jgi:hypothetical protein
MPPKQEQIFESFIYEGSVSSNSAIVRTKSRDQSLVDAINNRLALDAAAIDIQHCYVDEDDRFIEMIYDSELNETLRVSPNLDQAPRQFRLDMYLSMIEWGVIAVCPIKTIDRTPNDPDSDASIRPTNLRVGKIVQWKPDKVKVDLYNEWTGKHEQIWYYKTAISIVANPFYDIMNRPNAAIQRLKAKLSLSDIIDNRSKSNKFDIIVQMPYGIKTEGKKKLAEDRIKRLEKQLEKSSYGIGYIDATEKVTQLNRSLDNNIQAAVEYYYNLVLTQFGLTPEIMNGTADEKVMNNYYTRTVEPFVVAVCEEMKRKFLSKTARSQYQSIKYYRDPFALVSPSELPDTVDKFTRNAVVTTNEMRQAIGMRPSMDPGADELRNKNISEAADQVRYDINGNPINTGQEQVQEEPIE